MERYSDEAALLVKGQQCFQWNALKTSAFRAITYTAACSFSIRVPHAMALLAARRENPVSQAQLA